MPKDITNPLDELLSASVEKCAGKSFTHLEKESFYADLSEEGIKNTIEILSSNVQEDTLPLFEEENVKYLPVSMTYRGASPFGYEDLYLAYRKGEK